MRTLPAILLLTACSASTYLTDVHREPGAQFASYQRVAAVVVAQDEDTRREAEDEIVRQLGARGVASYTILTPEDERSPESVRQKLLSAGCDGAVVMSLLSAGEEPIDVTGNIPDAHKAFTGYYGAGRGQAAGWEQVVRIETEIFALAENRLLWSAASKTFEASSAREVVADVSKAVAAEIRKTAR